MSKDLVRRDRVRSNTHVQRSYFYLFLLCLLAIILYLDRVCISVAGPRMQEALHLGPVEWGLVGTFFTLGYGLFEIPSGHWGDKLGARRVLTRIVIWWSAFTAITGTVSSFPLLLGVRFLFGAGEAGALPNAGVAISNWFPPEKRGRAFGLFSMCTQIGGALSPVLVLPIQQAYGWRMSFYVFGCVGVLWGAFWFWKYRDSPEGMKPRGSHGEHLSWGTLMTNRNVWLVLVLAFCYVYTLGFFQTWLHTYLEKGRGFSERNLILSALPFVFAAAANLLGGLSCDWLAKRVGMKWSRRGVGMAGLAISAIFMASAVLFTGQLPLILCLSMGYAGLTFQQPVVFSTCLDIGGRRGGAVLGLMNTAGQVGAAVSSAAFGYIVKTTGSYDAPLMPMAFLLMIGMLMWAKVDVTQRVSGGE
jgi:ACS family glucarate transporter-like MFS transporter